MKKFKNIQKIGKIIIDNKTNKSHQLSKKECLKLSKFYTKYNSVKMCIELLKKTINIDNDDLIIEPSAGNGAFISEIKKLNGKKLFYDISPEHNEIIKQDYLTLDEQKILDTKPRCIHLIGNPPFGDYSKLARKFIKKSCLFADTISFILPSAFSKPSFLNGQTFNKYFHLEKNINLNDCFTVNGEDHKVNCVFQIWIKKNTEREKIEKIQPDGFKFVSQSKNPRFNSEIADIAFIRARGRAGTIYINDKEETGDMLGDTYITYIKFNENIDWKSKLESLKKIEWNNNNTTTQKSISQAEISCKFNKMLMDK
tara:strand:+ start:725 stop:1660 length:936 start_codon:yes stop_codon:yes gene_type:complete